jgi:hypothetical protein
MFIVLSKLQWYTNQMERFWNKVIKQENGCWEWQAALREGYGAFKLNGKVIGAHVYSYSLTHGEITRGLVICHSCDNRKCVNPEHLWLGTYSDNMQDASVKGRLISSRKKYRTKEEKRHANHLTFYAKHKDKYLARKRELYHLNKIKARNSAVE